eukprot:GDKI01021844.1.p1 GENE.GDKI01021844.1~~GDKI01021844.1.p1  ORF type:complete len:340 (+),score=67.97 GDKI01021844.1:78-1022(+)
MQPAVSPQSDPPVVFDPLIHLSIGGMHFALKKSVVAEVPLFEARFGGSWTGQQGERDEYGWVVKGVRGDLFGKLLPYIEKKAVERKFELESTPHPLVEGKNTQAYLRMLEYLCFPKRVVEEAQGDVFIEQNHSHARVINDGKTGVTKELEDVWTHVCTHTHKFTDEAECRVKFTKPTGLALVRAEEDDISVPILIAYVCAEEGESEQTFIQRVDEMSVEEFMKSGTATGLDRATVTETFGRDVFACADCVLCLRVDKYGRLTYIIEKGEEVYAFCVHLPAHKIGVYRFGVRVSDESPWVCATLLPPKNTEIITV